MDFEVVTSVLAASPLPFSPNGDGLPETVDFDYSRMGPWTSAKVEVRNAADVLGGFLPDGSYTASLVVTRTLESDDVASSTYDQTFAIDSTALAPLKLTPSPSTFYPYRDGYRDSTKVVYSNGESYSRVDLKVRNSAGNLVRSKQIFS